MDDKYTDIQHWIEGVQTLNTQPPTSKSPDAMEGGSPRVSRIKEWAKSDDCHICPEELIRCVVAFVQDVVEDPSNKELRDIIKSVRGNLETLRESDRPISLTVAQEILADLKNLVGTSSGHLGEGSPMDYMKKIFAKLGQYTPTDIQEMSRIPDAETRENLRQPYPLPALPFGAVPGASSHNRDRDSPTTATGTSKTGAWGQSSTTRSRMFDAGTPSESVNTGRSTYPNTTTNESRYGAHPGRNYGPQNNHSGHMNIYGPYAWPRDDGLAGQNSASPGPTFINGSGNILAHTMSDFNNVKTDNGRRRKGKGRSSESWGDSDEEE